MDVTTSTTSSVGITATTSSEYCFAVKQDSGVLPCYNCSSWNYFVNYIVVEFLYFPNAFVKMAIEFYTPQYTP